MKLRRLRRNLPLVLALALCLCSVQGFGAVHGIDHLVMPDDAVCGLCLNQHQCKQAVLPFVANDVATDVNLPSGDSVRAANRIVFILSHFPRAPPRLS